VVPQIQPTPGLGERAGVQRRQDRVMRILHTLPRAAQQGIIESLTDAEKARYGIKVGAFRPSPRPREWQPDSGDLTDNNVADLPTSNWREQGGRS
jgi:phospholipid/cholesterol/gamma-HCH transport system ATP-binding protein